jgi:hypothetical protein
MPIQKYQGLAQKWYTGRLDHDWQRPDHETTRKIYENIDLIGPFGVMGNVKIKNRKKLYGQYDSSHLILPANR